MFWFFILALAFIYILQLLIPSFTETFFLDPNKPYEIWRLFTSIFLHGSATHLFFNLLTFFFFTPYLLKVVGSEEFIKIFFIGGIVGNILYLLLVYAGISPPVPALGASGAIYAILGATVLFFPNSIVYFYLLPLKITHAALLLIIINLIYIFDWSSGIGGAAHLGGLAFGYFYANYLKNEKGYGFIYY